MEIKVPAVGESVFEATIGKWHKRDGEAVRKDEILCELETDKITLELNAEADGVLSIGVQEGETVKVGTVIGTLREGAAPAAEKPAPVETGPPEEKQAAEKQAPPPETPTAKIQEAIPEPAREAERREERRERERREERREPVRPEPKAEKAAPPPPAAEKSSEERITRRPMSAIRRRIAERLVAVRQQTAMLTTFNEADLGRVQELRRKHRESFRRKHGVGLGLMSFFVRASVQALKEFPEVNARIDGEDLVFQNFYDIGIAVAGEKGLVVPVLRDADRLLLAQIEQAIAELVEKVRSNRIGLAELEGGTFTITNGGVFGSLLSTPILNPPQSGVLGMHTIQERPVVREGEIVIRPMMYLALSYDHRIIDGRQAVGFLKRVKEYVEEPEEMLLEL